MSESTDRRAQFRAAPSPSLPPWADCECFCIRNYAGAKLTPCGWRGRRREALPDDAGRPARCPRCGGATLLKLPGRAGDAPRT